MDFVACTVMAIAQTSWNCDWNITTDTAHHLDRAPACPHGRVLQNKPAPLFSGLYSSSSAFMFMCIGGLCVTMLDSADHNMAVVHSCRCQWLSFASCHLQTAVGCCHVSVVVICQLLSGVNACRLSYLISFRHVAALFQILLCTLTCGMAGRTCQ